MLRGEKNCISCDLDISHGHNAILISSLDNLTAPNMLYYSFAARLAFEKRNNTLLIYKRA